MSKKIFTKLALKNSLSKPIYFEACITNFTKIQTKFLQNPEGERGGGERENRLWSEAFQSTPNWHKGREWFSVMGATSGTFLFQRNVQTKTKSCAFSWGPSTWARTEMFLFTSAVENVLLQCIGTTLSSFPAYSVPTSSYTEVLSHNQHWSSPSLTPLQGAPGLRLQTVKKQ